MTDRCQKLHAGRNPQHRTQLQLMTSAATVMAAIRAAGVVCATAAVLAACGGGDPLPDDTESTIMPVDCGKQPQACK